MKKIFKVTDEYIETYARGDPFNNPIVCAIKEQVFPDAQEIIVHDDEVYIDGELWELCIEAVRFMIDWDKGKRVQPMILALNSMWK